MRGKGEHCDFIAAVFFLKEEIGKIVMLSFLLLYR